RVRSGAPGFCPARARIGSDAGAGGGRWFRAAGRIARVKSSREFLEQRGLPGRDPVECPTSIKRFPDGGQYRIEIPSTEGPRSLEQVLSEAGKRKVPVHRVSQGSGIMLMTDDEISEMLEIGRKAKIEVNLFIGQRATFDLGAQA